METTYRNISVQVREIEKRKFLVAETQSLLEAGVNRQHSRIISADPPSQVVSHPLVYTDDYTMAHDYKLYVYARHRVNQTQFFSLVDSFLEGHESNFREIINNPFRCVLNISGRIAEGEIRRPFSENLKDLINQISFVRLYAPFGDVSIDFSEKPCIRSDELRFTNERLLSRQIEYPIFAFDASESDIWAPFLAKVHWAADFLPKEVLEVLIQEATRVKIRV